MVGEVEYFLCHFLRQLLHLACGKCEAVAARAQLLEELVHAGVFFLFVHAGGEVAFAVTLHAEFRLLVVEVVEVLEGVLEGRSDEGTQCVPVVYVYAEFVQCVLCTFHYSLSAVDESSVEVEEYGVELLCHVLSCCLSFVLKEGLHDVCAVFLENAADDFRFGVQCLGCDETVAALAVWCSVDYA